MTKIHLQINTGNDSSDALVDIIHHIVPSEDWVLDLNLV